MKSNDTKSTYLALEVPIGECYHDAWFVKLREVFADANIDWLKYKKHYHLTLVFIDKRPGDNDFRQMIKAELASLHAQRIRFAKIDAFTGGSGKHVIHLDTTEPCEELSEFGKRIRKVLRDKGCTINYEFKLHLTLTEIEPSVMMTLDEVRKRIGGVTFPSVECNCKDVYYKRLGGKGNIFHEPLS